MAEQRLSNMRQRNGFIALDDFAFYLETDTTVEVAMLRGNGVEKLRHPSQLKRHFSAFAKAYFLLSGRKVTVTCDIA